MRPWTPLRVGLCAAAFAAAIAGIQLLAAGGDVDRFVHAAPPWTDPEHAPSWLTVVPAEDGFDGQFYLLNALTPLSDDESAEGITYDLAPLRAQRRTYPLAALMLAGGVSSLLPYTLVATNVLAFGAMVGFGTALVPANGRRVCALGLALAPAAIYTIGRDLTELVTVAFGLGALWALRADRVVLAAGMLSLAVLSRESALVIVAGLGVEALWELRRRRLRLDLWLPVICASAVWLANQAFVAAQHGETGFSSTRGVNLVAPFTGLAESIDGFLPSGGGAAALRVLSVVALGVIALVVLRAWRGEAPLHLRVAWLASVALVLCSSAFIWAGATSFMRVGTEWWVLGVVLACTLAPSRADLGRASRGVALVMIAACIVVIGAWSATLAAEVGKLA